MPKDIKDNSAKVKAADSSKTVISAVARNKNTIEYVGMGHVSTNPSQQSLLTE